MNLRHLNRVGFIETKLILQDKCANTIPTKYIWVFSVENCNIDLGHPKSGAPVT